MTEHMTPDQVHAALLASGTRRGKQPESVPLRAIRTAFGVIGWKTYRTQEGPFGLKGLADLICVSPEGLVLFVEVKRPGGGVVRKDQRLWLAAMRTQNAPCCVMDSHRPVLLFQHCRGRREAAVAICDRLMRDFDWWPGER